MASTYKSSDTILQTNKRDLTDNAFTGNMTVSDGTTTTTLSQNSTGVNYEAQGLVVSDNLLVNGLLYVGNGGGAIVGSISSDGFTLSVNTPISVNPNGFQDCQMTSIALTDPASASNNIYLGYESSTRLVAKSTGGATTLGVIAYTSDIYSETRTFSTTVYTASTWASSSTAIQAYIASGTILQILPANGAGNSDFDIPLTWLTQGKRVCVYNTNTASINASINIKDGGGTTLQTITANHRTTTSLMRAPDDYVVSFTGF